MNFLNPVWLFGLLAAAIPILIHLFTRRRPREVRFPSLEFLMEVNQSEIRRLKLKQWLLLLLRTLAVAAIALAMARPAVRGSVGPQSTAATTVVVLVDRSASMGAVAADGRTLVAAAARVVEDLITTLGPADELLLVPYDRAPEPFTERPSADVSRVRAAAQSLAPSARTTDHRRALEAAAAALAGSNAINRELFWLSDFQARGFDGAAGAAGSPTGTGPAGAEGPPEAGAEDPGTDAGAASAMRPTLPPGPWDRARVYLVPFEPRRRANVAVVSAELAPTESGAALSVTGASYGAPPGDLAVEVRDAEGEIGRGFLALPARGEGSALLPLARLPAEGGTVRTPEDALPLDDARAFAAGRGGTLRVLLREDGPPSPLRLALEAGSPASGLAVEVVDAAGFAQRLTGADVLVIHDLQSLGPVETQAALDFARAGGGLLLAPGRRADAAAWNAALLPGLGAGELGGLTPATPGASWRLTRALAGHPVLAGFPARVGEPLSSARFTTVRAFRPGPGARVVLGFDRAHPALVESPRALLLLPPLDVAASDFAVSGVFLPLLHQAVKVLGRGTAAPSLVPGERYSAPAATGTWRIEHEDGREVPSELAAVDGATRLESAPLERTGLYRVLQDGRLRGTFAVNLDPVESDLTPVSETALVAAFPSGRAQVLRPGSDLARRVREARYGRELWSAFVIAALLLLALETVIARWGLPGPTARAASPAA